MTIQEAGLEILGGTPRKFYIFGGSEYGIKSKYLRTLEDHYHVKKEVDSVASVIDLMSTKHFVPLKPALYVSRYDSEFISQLSESFAKKLKSVKIIGTLVCLYESDKDVSKCEKYLAEETVRIDSVSRNFVIRYLHSDFPKLPDRLIESATDMSSSYGQAMKICSAMSTVDPEILFSYSDKDLAELFGTTQGSEESDIRVGVAARNPKYVLEKLENYSGDLNNLLYAILSTMLELEKLVSSSRGSSDLQDYKKRWTPKDVYNMFMNTYSAIWRIRTYSTDIYSELVMLVGLLQFSEIPEVEVS